VGERIDVNAGRGRLAAVEAGTCNPIIKWWRRVFPFSNQGLGLENDVLDTFDGYSPRFHGIHSPKEVEEWFHAAGLVSVRRLLWNTAVRGRRAA
jgi:hypothetical protein